MRVLHKRFPSFPALCNPLSFLLAARGDSTEALSAAEEYARLAPQLPASSAFYGRALQVRRRYDEAEAQYRRSLTLAPARPDYPFDARSAMAELNELRGRSAEARAIAKEGIGRAVDASDSALYRAGDAEPDRAGGRIPCPRRTLTGPWCSSPWVSQPRGGGAHRRRDDDGVRVTPVAMAVQLTKLLRLVRLLPEAPSMVSYPVKLTRSTRGDLRRRQRPSRTQAEAEGVSAGSSIAPLANR